MKQRKLRSVLIGPISKIVDVAEKLGRSGRFAESEDLLLRALTSHPDSVELWEILGRAQFEQEQHERAAASLGRAVALGSIHAYSLRGLVHENLLEFDQAEADYRAFLTSYPEDVDTLTNLGTLLETRGELDDALALLSRAVAIDPTANWQLSGVLEKLGRSEEAIAAARKAIASGEERAYLELAEMLSETAPLEEVSRYFKKAIASGRSWARREFAIYLDLNGFPDVARSVARMGVELGDELCYAPLAVILEADGDLFGAVENYELAVAAGDVGYEDTLAELKLRIASQRG